MKRRTFIQGLLATPIAAYGATKLPSDEVDNGIYEVKSVRRPGIYRALITANSGMEAGEIWTAMGRPADIKIVGPGAMLCGMGTEMLMLAHDPDSYFWDGSTSTIKMNKAWIDEVCRTRLLPGGKEASVRFIEDSFDWGTKCGVAASFVSGGKEMRQARRFHVPLSELTYPKRIEAKAQLLRWYIERSSLPGKGITGDTLLTGNEEVIW